MTSRRQLALQYFPGIRPESAARRLTRWIQHCTELHALLLHRNPSFPKSKYLTVWEVRKIMEYLRGTVSQKMGKMECILTFRRSAGILHLPALTSGTCPHSHRVSVRTPTDQNKLPGCRTWCAT